MHDLKQQAKGRKEDHRSPATLRSRAITALKGMAMGIADSVPGVSGGTIAVMAGIYEELIESLRHLNPVTLWSWRRLGWPASGAQ